MITITAKVNGFRRAGIAHPATATEYPDDAFTAAQMAALESEPMLVVVVSADAKGGKKKDKAGGDAPQGDTATASENTGEQA